MHGPAILIVSGFRRCTTSASKLIDLTWSIESMLRYAVIELRTGVDDLRFMAKILSL